MYTQIKRNKHYKSRVIAKSVIPQKHNTSIQREIIVPNKGTLRGESDNWMTFMEAVGSPSPFGIPFGIWGSQRVRDHINNRINEFDWYSSDQIIQEIREIWFKERQEKGDMIGIGIDGKTKRKDDDEPDDDELMKRKRNRRNQPPGNGFNGFNLNRL